MGRHFNSDHQVTLILMIATVRMKYLFAFQVDDEARELGAVLRTLGEQS